MEVTNSDDWKALTRAMGQGEVFRINDRDLPSRRRWAGDMIVAALEQGHPVKIEQRAIFDGSPARTRPEGPLVGGTETVFTPMGPWPNVP